MSKPIEKIEMLIIGVHLNSEGYPNVRYRIREFRQSDWLEITEICHPMLGEDGWFKHNNFGVILGLFRSIYAHLLVLVKYLINGRASLVYVPYPAVFIGFILGLLPRAFRPKRILLDAFISLFDTVVNDRKLLSRGNWIAGLLKYIEKTAYSNADIVIVDTQQSSTYLCREFNLPEKNVVGIPLSSDERNFHLQPYLPNDEICRVLFIGTFVPLHGVSTILSAAANLRDCQNIQFQIVGSGQMATDFEDMFKRVEVNLEWIRSWQTPEALARMIAQADICLGIFGIGEKAQRVCPFKLYAYATCGRAIITGATDWARHAEIGLTYKPFETVPVNNSVALANQIKKLANSLANRRLLAKNSRRFYEEQLSNKIALSKLRMLLSGR